MLKESIYRLKYRYGRFLNLEAPVDVTLELSSHCNQACGYCYHSKPNELPFTKGFMTWPTIYKIINQSAELGVNSIKFNSKGESTLNQYFWQATGLAKSRAQGSTFIDRITNSNFKFGNNRDDIFLGLLNQTKVKVSLDSFIPEVMHKQRAGSNLSLVIANVNKFYNWHGRKTILVIQSVRTQLNKDEDLYGEIKRRWPDAQVSIRDVVEGRVDRSLADVIVSNRDTDNRVSCLQAHARLIFNKDGIATACCPDIGEILKLGDINTMTLSEIWNSEAAKKLRTSLKNKTAFENDPCKTCSSFESYKGFRARWNS